MRRQGLSQPGTVVEWVDQIQAHQLNSRALGHAAYVLADLQHDLEHGPDPEVPNVNDVLHHAGVQLVLLEFDGQLVCPVCGRKD